MSQIDCRDQFFHGGWNAQIAGLLRTIPFCHSVQLPSVLVDQHRPENTVLQAAK